jgi:hypothetical protein
MSSLPPSSYSHFGRFKEPPCRFKFAHPPLPVVNIQVSFDDEPRSPMAVSPLQVGPTHPSRARPRTRVPHLRSRSATRSRPFAVQFMVWIRTHVNSNKVGMYMTLSSPCPLPVRRSRPCGAPTLKYTEHLVRLTKIIFCGRFCIPRTRDSIPGNTHMMRCVDTTLCPTAVSPKIPLSSQQKTPHFCSYVSISPPFRLVVQFSTNH